MNEPKKKPLKRTSGVESAERVNDIYVLMMEGIPKKEIFETLKKKWNLSHAGVQHIYTRALARIKKEFYAPIEDLRAGIIADILIDIRVAFRNYEKYDAFGDSKSSDLAHKWFSTYLALKKEYVEYYPGVKPKEIPVKDEDLSIVFMPDDGIDDEPNYIEHNTEDEDGN